MRYACCHEREGEGQRHARGPVGAADAESPVRVPDGSRPRRGSARADLHGRDHRAPLPPAGDRGSARDAAGARRLDAARQRRRAEAGEGRHRRGVGARPVESGRWLVRAQEGSARTVRQLRAAGPRGDGPGRGRAQRRATTACARSDGAHDDRSHGERGAAHVRPVRRGHASLHRGRDRRGAGLAARGRGDELDRDPRGPCHDQQPHLVVRGRGRAGARAGPRRGVPDDRRGSGSAARHVRIARRASAGRRSPPTRRSTGRPCERRAAAPVPRPRRSPRGGRCCTLSSTSGSTWPTSSSPGSSGRPDRSGNSRCPIRRSSAEREDRRWRSSG